MSLLVLVDQKPWSPERAAREALPLDTELACPHCNGRHVKARMARTVEQIVGDRTRQVSDIELQQFVPRWQDRWCQDCGEKWQTLLPPTSYSDPSLR